MKNKTQNVHLVFNQISIEKICTFSPKKISFRILANLICFLFHCKVFVNSNLKKLFVTKMCTNFEQCWLFLCRNINVSYTKNKNSIKLANIVENGLFFQICSEYPVCTGEGAGDRKITLTQAIFHISVLSQPDEEFLKDYCRKYSCC
jgi:hypothetical protein